MARSAGAEADGAGEVVAGDAGVTASLEARVAQQVDVERALVRREAQRGEQHVFHLFPHADEIEICGQEIATETRRHREKKESGFRIPGKGKMRSNLEAAGCR